MEELFYAIALSRLRGITQAAALDCLRRYGSARAVYEHRDEIVGRGGRALTGWSEALRCAEAELEFCTAHGVVPVSLCGDDYPSRLRECADAPLVLYGKGTACLNARRAVAVVGTRRITEYGKDLCRHLVQDLVAMFPDCLVVSGLAYGVDIHAHRAALEAGAQTVGVLAHGLDTIYPSSHRATAAAMTGQGGLLTEYVAHTPAEKGNFVRRNRIVAGMTDATVVVESAEKGGALITARLARDYSREVFAFPGRVGDAASAGCNALIRSSVAALITSAADMADALGWVPAAESRPVQLPLFPELSPAEKLLCDLLRGQEAKSVNQLAVGAALPVQQVSALLFELELKGVVGTLSGGRYRLVD